VLAESGSADRLVRFANALLGWVPGGLAIVTIGTCALFTVFTGASGVTVRNMLKGQSQNVECASCHDIHATIGAATSGTGIMTIASGQNLCLGCHNK